MANKKFTDLTNKTTAGATDVIAIVDPADNTSKRTTVGGLITALLSVIPGGSIITAMLADNAVTAEKVDFTSFPICRVISSVNQTVSNTTGTEADITMSTVMLNVGGFSLSSSSVVVPEDGLYEISATVATTDSQNFFALFQANGATIKQLSFSARSSTSRGYQTSCGSTVVPLTAGQSVKLRYQNRDFATVISSGAELIVRRVG